MNKLKRKIMEEDQLEALFKEEAILMKMELAENMKILHQLSLLVEADREEISPISLKSSSPISIKSSIGSSIKPSRSENKMFSSSQLRKKRLKHVGSKCTDNLWLPMTSEWCIAIVLTLNGVL